MQDGSNVCFKLLSSHQINGIIFYLIELHAHGQIYTWKQRFSTLKDICQEFPQATHKFPPKNSIRHVLSQITGSQGFLQERFNLMKEYFNAVSTNDELEFNKAFLQIYRRLQHQKNQVVNGNHAQKAPVIRGKKLQIKQQTETDLYIIL